uniref:Uncharacterized protein n=1 Tax=Megaselia scalaris TaxID=36166 RepID=T1H0I7_MEGSC
MFRSVAAEIEVAFVSSSVLNLPFSFPSDLLKGLMSTPDFSSTFFRSCVAPGPYMVLVSQVAAFISLSIRVDCRHEGVSTRAMCNLSDSDRHRWTNYFITYVIV